MNKPNFIEKDTVEEAQTINLDHYTFLEKMSATRNKYCFKIRELKRTQ